MKAPQPSEDSEALSEANNPVAGVTSRTLSSCASASSLPATWFAVYTTPRHEKRIAEYFAVQEIESFLPLYKTQARWKDGSKVELQLPLFPNYVFAHIVPSQRVPVLQTPGVVSIVGNSREATPIPEQTMDTLRAGLLSNAEPHPYIVIGERARIRTGPLTGVEGIVVRKKNGFRIVLAIHEIMKSIAVEVDQADLEPLQPRSSFTR